MLLNLLYLGVCGRRRCCRELRGDGGKLLLELGCLLVALFRRCRGGRLPGERVGAFLLQLVFLLLALVLVLRVLLLVLCLLVLVLLVHVLLHLVELVLVPVLLFSQQAAHVFELAVGADVGCGGCRGCGRRAVRCPLAGTAAAVGRWEGAVVPYGSPRAWCSALGGRVL